MKKLNIPEKISTWNRSLRPMNEIYLADNRLEMIEDKINAIIDYLNSQKGGGK